MSVAGGAVFDVGVGCLPTCLLSLTESGEALTSQCAGASTT